MDKVHSLIHYSNDFTLLDSTLNNVHFWLDVRGGNFDSLTYE